MKKLLFIFLLSGSAQAQTLPSPTKDTLWNMWYVTISDTTINMRVVNRLYIRAKTQTDSTAFMFWEFRSVKTDSTDWDAVLWGGYPVTGQNFIDWNHDPSWLMQWVTDSSRLNLHYW